MLVVAIDVFGGFLQHNINNSPLLGSLVCCWPSMFSANFSYGIVGCFGIIWALWFVVGRQCFLRISVMELEL